mgnify:CR=1 FL=1
MLYRYHTPKDHETIMTNRVIVIDIDETLVRTFDEDEDISYSNFKEIVDELPLIAKSRIYQFDLYDVIEGTRGKGDKMRMFGVIRPYVDEFLEFCFKYFQLVCVWSAGKPDYVDGICQTLFKDKSPHIVYTSEHCEERIKRGGKETIKPIEKMINMNSKQPSLEGLMRFDNTLCLDDRESTFSENPKNGILIPSWSPEPTVQSLMDNSDQALHQLQHWLLEHKTGDVRNLHKNTIFDNVIL